MTNNFYDNYVSPRDLDESCTNFYAGKVEDREQQQFTSSVLLL